MLPETDPDIIDQCREDFETKSQSGAHEANSECLRYPPTPPPPPHTHPKLSRVSTYGNFYCKELCVYATGNNPCGVCRYVWALVHSRSNRDVTRGLELAEGMINAQQVSPHFF